MLETAGLCFGGDYGRFEACLRGRLKRRPVFYPRPIWTLAALKAELGVPVGCGANRSLANARLRQRKTPVAQGARWGGEPTREVEAAHLVGLWPRCYRHRARKGLFVLAHIAAPLAVGCQTALPARAPVPTLSVDCAFCPELETPSESWWAGTGFFAKHQGVVFCMWAHHLYDAEVGPLNHIIHTWGFGNRWEGPDCHPLQVINASTDGFGNDIAVARPHAPPTHFLDIATRTPQEGDPIWLLAEPWNSDAVLHEGVVTDVDLGELSYSFYDLGGWRMFGRTSGYGTVIAPFDKLAERIKTREAHEILLSPTRSFSDERTFRSAPTRCGELHSP